LVRLWFSKEVKIGENDLHLNFASNQNKKPVGYESFSSSRCKNGLKQITLLSPTLRFKVKKIRHYLFRHFDARPPVNTGRWSKSQAIVVNIALFEVIN